MEIKQGDTVKDSRDSLWGETLFKVELVRQFGNLSLALCHIADAPVTNGNKCNFLTQRLRLVNAEKRPLRNLNTQTVIKLMSKGNKEAKREFVIRIKNGKKKHC